MFCYLINIHRFIGIFRKVDIADFNKEVNSMIWSNMRQFLVTGNYSKTHMVKGEIDMISSTSISAAKMYSTYLLSIGHSKIFPGRDGSVFGFNFGTANATTGNIVTGVVTTLSGTNVFYNTGTLQTGNIVTGVVTTLSGSNATYTTGNFTTANATTGNIVTGIVTTISGTNAFYNTGTLQTGNIVTGIVTTLFTSGTATIATGNIVTGVVTTLSGTNLNYTGISTLGITSTTNLTAQQLQVTGGAYVSGNLGVGTTNPTSKLDVVGNIKLTGE